MLKDCGLDEKLYVCSVITKKVVTKKVVIGVTGVLLD